MDSILFKPQQVRGAFRCFSFVRVGSPCATNSALPVSVHFTQC
jgi:hypothetical protein